MIWLADLNTTSFFEMNEEVVIVSIGSQYIVLNKNTGEIVNSVLNTELTPKKNENVDVRKTLGIFNGILWIALNNSMLVGFDVNNPLSKYFIPIPEVFKGKSYPMYTQLDVTGGFLFGMEGPYYWQIDLNKDEYLFEVIDISSELEKAGLSTINRRGISEWPFTSGYIYFGDMGWSEDDSLVGKFNRSSLKIDWCSKELEGDGIFQGIRNMAYSADKLYILDTKKTLHILKDE